MSTQFNVQECLQNCKKEATYKTLTNDVKNKPNEARTKISSFLSTVKDPEVKRQLQENQSNKDQLIEAIQRDITGQRSGQTYGANQPRSQSGQSTQNPRGSQSFGGQQDTRRGSQDFKGGNPKTGR